MTGFDSLLPHTAAQAAEPARHWWMGWAQLLCAWVVCMLLCVNAAILLDRGFFADETPSPAPAARRVAAACGTPALATETVADRGVPRPNGAAVKASNCAVF